MRIYFYLFLIISLALTYSCQPENASPDSGKKQLQSFDSLIITANDLRVSGLMDTLAFAKSDSIKTLSFEAFPETDSILVAKNSNDFQVNGTSLSLSPGDSIIRFFIAKTGYYTSDTFMVHLTDDPSRYVHEVTFYPNPFDTTGNLRITGKSRGEVNLSIYSQVGNMEVDTSATKLSDTLICHPEVDKLEEGIYLMQTSHGGSLQVLKIIKE